MSQPVATFSPPDDFDAVALARSTNRALQVLLPWCQVHKSYASFTPQFAIFIEALYSSELTFAGDIAAQALAYVEAIHLSVVAAQNGFTVAEEAISLGDLIPISIPNQHQSYLEGMLTLARDGRNNATKTLQTFRDVRQKVLAVCRLFLCPSLVFTCSGQLLKKVKPEHEAVVFDFYIHINGRSMAISLYLYRYAHSEQ